MVQPCSRLFGRVSEWLKVSVLKTDVRQYRGFESHPVRKEALQYHSLHTHSCMHLYIQEAMWKSVYVLLSALFCFCICTQFFDVLLFHHVHVFFAATQEETLITSDVTEGFSTMLVLCTYITLVCVCPLCMYFFLTFVFPSCFRLEALLLLGMSLFSSMVFVCSYALAIHIVCPLVWDFFLSTGKNTHTWYYVPRLASSVSLLVSMLCTVHFLCQLPCLACVVQVFWHVPHSALEKHRKKIHVILVLVSALTSPPDACTQALCWLCCACIMESVFFFMYVTHAYGMSLKPSL